MTALAPTRPSTVAPDARTPLATLRRHRPDIEGLRAVAVLLVVLFHAGVPGIPGGFVGVDVFFVISGYLITGHLLTELQAHGRIRLGAFYARRARRLLPLATVVIVAMLLVYQAAASVLETRTVALDALWTALFAMNVNLAMKGVDYQANQDPSPFNHFWSLGVEEQFYLLWPALLLVGFVLVARRLRTPGAQQLALAGLVGLVAAGSFVWTLDQMVKAPAQSYFLLPTRAWELAVGGLVALAAPWLARRGSLQNGLLALAGLGLVGLAATQYSEATVFPGAAALLPVLGTAAVLAGGLTGDHAVQRFALGTRPMTAIGRWSYGWYLWHWGPLVLCATLLGRDLTVQEGLLLAAVTLTLAAATFSAIETPFRSRLVFVRRPRSGLLLGAGCVGLSVVLALSVLQTLGPATGDPSRQAAVVAVDSGRVDVLSVAATGPVPGNLSPSLDDAGRDAPDLAAADGQSCHARIVSPELSENGTGTCVSGGTENGSRTVMLLGDSHAHQWLPALQEIAPTRDWRLINLTKGACPLYDVQLVNNQLQRDYTECYDWRTKVWERVAAERPAMIVVSAAIFSEREGDFAARWSTGVDTTLARLQSTGATIVMIADTPFPRKDIPKCLAAHLSDAQSCAFSVDAGQSDPQRRAATTAAAQRAGVTVVDPTAWFCGPTDCPAVLGNALVYRDNSHVSTVYARQVAPLLAAVLPAL
ncbi:acyltransferase family protein [Nakamurella flava]|nr:acyltransferase family protein [Nakamurella flava]